MTNFEHETEFNNLDGSITLFEIPHGLGQRPYSATTKIKGTNNKYFVDFDQTNLTIVFSTPPVGKIIVKWSAFK